MKLVTKIIALLAIVLAIAILVVSLNGCNMGIADTVYKFDYAIIALPNGETIEGSVDKWIDFEGSDMIQVKIDGKWYLTHSMNVLLVSE